MDSSTQSWAEQEFGNADLGDYRRTQRLIQLAEQRGSQPNASITQSCGDNAAAKAAYRFYENDAISITAILSSHQQETTRNNKVCLCILPSQSPQNASP